MDRVRSGRNAEPGKEDMAWQSFTLAVTFTAHCTLLMTDSREHRGPLHSRGPQVASGYDPAGVLS